MTSSLLLRKNGPKPARSPTILIATFEDSRWDKILPELGPQGPRGLLTQSRIGGDKFPGGLTKIWKIENEFFSGNVLGYPPYQSGQPSCGNYGLSYSNRYAGLC
ncbi:hypothetical protein G9C98_000749 [Cotesia typhae]|uniref:Uncharacterized protein n=1 Tax=Cotesia typhae TaxID=2053667 RepID=A0A8J5RHN8_9HYME|nr:hypothetical protein G9C98_000749 [Cotesia typhae]